MQNSSWRKEKKLNREKVELAVIGGTGLETLLKTSEQVYVGTPFGLPSAIFICEVDDKRVAFLPRHGPQHSVPPHKINYRANIYALHNLGVQRIISTSAVGAINLNFLPGDLAIPHDLVDLTRSRAFTFYDESPVMHVDMSTPFCPETASFLVKAAKKFPRAWDRSVLACTDGPRYETPAEIEMLRRMGCDIVGMTVSPEAFLARELEMCYAIVCLVTNMAAGIQKRLTTSEVTAMAKEKMPIIQQMIKELIINLPHERHCPCESALRDAGF
jgi:5'-methylthioadenosine phosphorylase